MQTSKIAFRIVTLILAATLITACSKETKKARFLAEADNYFKAGNYDKAKLSYLNVLRLDPAKRARIRKNRSDVAGGRSTPARRCVSGQGERAGSEATLKIGYGWPVVMWPRDGSPTQKTKHSKSSSKSRTMAMPLSL